MQAHTELLSMTDFQRRLASRAFSMSAIEHKVRCEGGLGAQSILSHPLLHVTACSNILASTPSRTTNSQDANLSACRNAVRVKSSAMHTNFLNEIPRATPIASTKKCRREIKGASVDKEMREKWNVRTMNLKPEGGA
ncbi:hypothetical protein M758_UG321300 [Ceratodon purpureus]|nr:hypothetical protein M758_UG321300 [Ceratodon purpureus]